MLCWYLCSIGGKETILWDRATFANVHGTSRYVAISCEAEFILSSLISREMEEVSARGEFTTNGLTAASSDSQAYVQQHAHGQLALLFLHKQGYWWRWDRWSSSSRRGVRWHDMWWRWDSNCCKLWPRLWRYCQWLRQVSHSPLTLCQHYTKSLTHRSEDIKVAQFIICEEKSEGGPPVRVTETVCDYDAQRSANNLLSTVNSVTGLKN